MYWAYLVFFLEISAIYLFNQNDVTGTIVFWIIPEGQQATCRFIGASKAFLEGDMMWSIPGSVPCLWL